MQWDLKAGNITYPAKRSSAYVLDVHSMEAYVRSIGYIL